jgi:hypothetical protein
MEFHYRRIGRHCKNLFSLCLDETRPYSLCLSVLILLPWLSSPLYCIFVPFPSSFLPILSSFYCLIPAASSLYFALSNSVVDPDRMGSTSFSWIWIRISIQGMQIRIWPIWFGIIGSSVLDPDPHIFGRSGSGSTSQRYGSGSQFFYQQAKMVNLDS